jgi:hypothetical protein
MNLFPDNCDHGIPAFRTCEDCLIQIGELRAKLAAAETRIADLERDSAQMVTEDLVRERGAQEILYDRLAQAVDLMREEVKGTLCIMVDPKLVGRNVPGGITNSDQVPDCGCWWCRVRAYIREYDNWGDPAFAKDPRFIDNEPIHRWFELTYAQYLTVPRSALQSMPLEWQERFVRCLEQLDNTIDWLPEGGQYWVKLKDSDGRYMRDPLQDYERGRRRLPRKP